MAGWDNPQTEFLTTAAKVYAALAISYPSGRYSSDTVVTLNIEGKNYQCRCDSTGIIQCIIRVMGYDPNWGSSSVPGHTGSGWFLTDASGNFVKDKQGNISSDWKVLDFNPNNVLPGDIRAASSYSHCDIFVDYLSDIPYGLGSNDTYEILTSSLAGEKYQSDALNNDLLAVELIPSSAIGKVLRYVKGGGTSAPDNSVSNHSGQSLKNLDIELQFVEPIRFIYQMYDADYNLEPRVPGYYEPEDCYTAAGESGTSDYSDSWLSFAPVYRVNTKGSAEWESRVKNGLILMYTTDGSDPLQFGRTVMLKSDSTNDYERSKNIIPIIKTQFPVYFRGVLTDINHITAFARTSAFFTTQAADMSISMAQFTKAAKNSLFITDASGASPEAEDAHGYLMLHDDDEFYKKEDYATWVHGVKEESDNAE